MGMERKPMNKPFRSRTAGEKPFRRPRGPERLFRPLFSWDSFCSQEPCSVFKAEPFQGCSALVPVQLLKPESLGLFRITGKLGEDGIPVDSCPDPVAFGNQRFFKLFILLLRQFDAVLDLIKIKGVLSGIITAQRTSLEPSGDMTRSTGVPLTPNREGAFFTYSSIFWRFL